jgi:hypothetical protein
MLSTHIRLGLLSGLFPSFLPQLRYASRPPHPPNLIILLIFNFSLCRFLYLPFTSSIFGPNIFLSIPVPNTLCLCSFHNVADQVSHPYRTTSKIIVLKVRIFSSLEADKETDFGLNGSKHYQISIASGFPAEQNFHLKMFFPNT